MTPEGSGGGLGLRQGRMADDLDPVANFAPWISFGNWLWPSIRRQLFWAPSTSLKTMASAVLFNRQPLTG